jgi:hypothetical protein
MGAFDEKKEHKYKNLVQVYLLCKAFIFTLNIYSFNFFGLFDHIMVFPNVETLSLHIVFVLYHYRFGHMCTCYCFVPLSLQENWQSYRFFITLGIFEQLSLVLVTALGTLDAILLLKVTL